MKTLGLNIQPPQVWSSPSIFFTEQQLYEKIKQQSLIDYPEDDNIRFSFLRVLKCNFKFSNV